MTKYLQFNGTSDYLSVPSSLTFNKIIIDHIPNFRTSNNWNGLISSADSTRWLEVQTNLNYIGSSEWNQPIINGSNSSVFTNNVRQTNEFNTNSLQTYQVKFFSKGNSDFTNTQVYSIKIYNGASLVAFYDMSKGNVNDQSGNGYNATLVGGTWKDDDLTPPANVTYLTETHTATSVTLNWDNPLDTDFAKARVYRNNVQIAEVTTNTYTDTSLTKGTSVNYKVTALDISGNESSGVTITAMPNDPIQPSEYYLSFDGVDDYLKTPTLTYDKVVMDAYIELKSGVAQTFVSGGSPFVWYRQNGGNFYSSTDGNVISTVDGVTTAVIKDKVRQTLVMTYSTGARTSDLNVMGSSFGENVKSRIYNIKVYNGSTLVAHYNLQTGSLIDQTGNGFNATAYGGASFVKQPTYSLSMNGTDNYIQTPTLTFDEIIMDFAPNPKTWGAYISFTDAKFWSASFQRNDSGFDNWYINSTTGFASMSIDGVSQGTTSITLKKGIRVTARATMVGTVTDKIRFFTDFNNNSYTSGKIYSITILKGGVIQAYYDMSTKSLKDISGNGNDATLYGSSSTGKSYYLQMNGAGNVTTPSLTFDKIEFDFMGTPPDPNRNVSWLNWSAGYSGNFQRETDGTDVYNYVFEVIKSGITQTTGTTIVQSYQRNLLTFNLLVAKQTAPINFFGTGVYGNIYSIKIYNSNVLVASYNMSTGTVQDQSGNGKHATLNGGTWVENSQFLYESPNTGITLSMDGVDDYIQTPSITFDEFIMDFSATPISGAYYYDFRDGLDAYMYRTATNNQDAWSTTEINSGSVYLNQQSFSNGYNYSNLIPTNKRVTLRVKFLSTKTDNGNIFSAKDTTGRLKGTIYSIKFLNAGKVVAYYDMSTGTLYDQSGNDNHATLNGGTWIDAPYKHNYYLQMDGIDDCIRTPSITFNKVELDVYIEHTVGSFQTYFDARTGSTNGGYLLRETSSPNGLEQWGADVSSVLVDGVSGTINTSFVPTRKRHTLTINMATPKTDDVTLFSHYQLKYYLQGRIYGAKFWNGSTLVASYDMSTGTVQDQSGNGYHATLNGGTWVDNTPRNNYCLQLNGISDSLTTPSFTYDKIVLDLYVNSTQPSIKISGHDGVLMTSPLLRYQLDNTWYDTSGFTSTSGLTTDTRTTITLTMTARTNSTLLFAKDGQGNNNLKATAYDIKFYNGSTLIAWYDMAKGNVDDQSGNGYHASLSSGAWVRQPKYYLSFNGTTDYLKTPNLTYTKVEMDFMVKDFPYDSNNANSYLSDSGSTAYFVNRTYGNNGSDSSNGFNASVDGKLISGGQVVNINNRSILTATYTNSSSSTNFITFFGRTAYGNSAFIKGNIYSIKIWNGSNLVAYYDMSRGNVKDQSGNGNDGIIVGNPTWVNDAKYYLKMSQNDYIDSGNPFNINNVFKIKLNMRFPSAMLNATSYRGIISNGNLYSSIGYSLIYAGNTKTLDWYTKMDTGSVTVSTNMSFSSTKYYDIEINSDGTNTKIIVDGVTVATAPSKVPTNATNNLIIGRYYESNGIMSSASTSSGFDIKSLYIESNGKAILNYDMTTGTIVDQTLSQNNGLLTGGTWEVDSLIASGVTQSSSKVLWMFDPLDKYNEYQIYSYNQSTGSTVLIGRVKYENGKYNTYLETNLNYPNISQRNPVFLQGKLPMATNSSIKIVPVNGAYTSISNNVVSATTNALPSLTNLTGQKLNLNNLQWLFS